MHNTQCLFSHKFSTSAASSTEILGNSARAKALQSTALPPQPMHPVAFTQGPSELEGSRLTNNSHARPGNIFSPDGHKRSPLQKERAPPPHTPSFPSSRTTAARVKVRRKSSTASCLCHTRSRRGSREMDGEEGEYVQEEAEESSENSEDSEDSEEEEGEEEEGDSTLHVCICCRFSAYCVSIFPLLCAELLISLLCCKNQLIRVCNC